MVNIIRIDPTDRRQRRLFLDLPFRIYRDIPQWVPPLQGEIKGMLELKKHSFYHHGEAAFYLALESDGSPVGRLAVLDNHSYNQFNHEQTAFFYLFECIDDEQVSRMLFAAAFDWARTRNLKKVTGPKGFTLLDGIGMLSNGFEHRPAFGLPYNPAYYPRLVESAGFSPCGDLVSGFLQADTFNFPPKVAEVAELIQKKRGMRVVRFKNRREFSKIIPDLQKLYNASLEGTTGNIPLTEADVRTLANQLLWFADPRLIKIIMKGEEPIGFLLAYPDISAAVQRCRGRLFPLGWIDCLLETRRTRWVNINGAAIVEKYRGLGGTALLFNEMYRSVVDGGFKFADIVQIGVENERMQLELRNLGIDFYKVHRLYERQL